MNNTIFKYKEVVGVAKAAKFNFLISYLLPISA